MDQGRPMVYNWKYAKSRVGEDTDKDFQRADGLDPAMEW